MGQHNSIFRNDLSDFLTVSDSDFYASYTKQYANSSCVTINSLTASTTQITNISIIGFFVDMDDSEIKSMLQRISKFLSIYFQIPVQVLSDSTINTNKFVIKYHEKFMISASSIIASIDKKNISNTDAIICVTNHNIYSNVKNNIDKFTDIRSKISIIKHLSNINDTLQIICHVAGHLCNIPHCTHYKCVMNDTGFACGNDYNCTTEQLPTRVACKNNQPTLDLCPNCLKKYYFAHEFNIKKRYHELYLYYLSHDMQDQYEIKSILSKFK